MKITIRPHKRAFYLARQPIERHRTIACYCEGDPAFIDSVRGRDKWKPAVGTRPPRGQRCTAVRLLLLHHGLSDGRCDVGHRTEQHQRIILGWKKSAPTPEIGSVWIHSVDDQCATSDEPRSGDTALQSVLQQARANALSSPRKICCELSEQQTRNRVRRLTSPDGSRHRSRHYRSWRETVVADDAIVLLDNHDRCEPLLLVRQRTRFQPMVEGRLSAGELGNIVGRRQRLRS